MNDVMSKKQGEISVMPTDAILHVCNTLDQVVERYKLERDKLRVGKYEADVEALLLFNLGIKHVEGLLTLARHEQMFLASAYHLARAALECCVRAAWLVDDGDPLKREARWITHLNGEISALNRSNDRLKQVGEDAPAERERARVIGSFRDAVAGALKAQGGEPVKQMPNFEQMLSAIGGAHLYRVYIAASQYSHGGHASTWLYRSGGLGTEKQIRENVREEQWILPLRMCWLALGHPGDIVTTRISGSTSAAWSSECSASVEVAFQSLLTSMHNKLH